ncbi:MAG: hypothetical protein ABW216_03675 [Candidatus Rokuibacteriota bacterium]|jgi:hypothetical protein|nr:hypothetical protein [Patescibacteria group bacterium]
MSERFDDTSDEMLGRRLAGELPRHTAPARLRVSIVDAATPRSRRPAWLMPMLTAAATAMVLVLAVMPVLPRIVPADPVQRYVRAVVSEHSRAIMWGARHGEVLPTALPWLTQESGISLNRVFVGDERLTFVAAEPVYLERQRGVAIHYKDSDGHMISYVALPAVGLTVPDRERVQIERWRPALLRDSGFASWVWKQGDVGCFLVSDMVSTDDIERFKEYFVRIRVATEPVPAY